MFRGHRKKSFVTLRGFWPLRGSGEGVGGGGGGSESVRKEKFVTKTFLR